eukprot:scaffold7405_cov204-Amphora_coffeaeformis.AAC.3
MMSCLKKRCVEQKLLRPATFHVRLQVTSTHFTSVNAQMVPDGVMHFDARQCGMTSLPSFHMDKKRGLRYGTIPKKPMDKFYVYIHIATQFPVSMALLQIM